MVLVFEQYLKVASLKETAERLKQKRSNSPVDGGDVAIVDDYEVPDNFNNSN
jgi:hypothetical protein